jgi:hypothetical protein
VSLLEGGFEFFSKILASQVISERRLLGVRKSDGVPEPKSSKYARESHEERGDKESPKACIRLKHCEHVPSNPLL